MLWVRAAEAVRFGRRSWVRSGVVAAVLWATLAGLVGMHKLSTMTMSLAMPQPGVSTVGGDTAAYQHSPMPTGRTFGDPADDLADAASVRSDAAAAVASLDVTHECCVDHVLCVATLRASAAVRAPLDAAARVVPALAGVHPAWAVPARGRSGLLNGAGLLERLCISRT